MVKELSWYLEEGRFSNLTEELEGSLKKYEAAKDSGAASVTALREEARLLFEEHSVRSGLREAEHPYINIDAEFFSGGALDHGACDTYIKNIIKGHCYQKVLWTYMGTTGALTAISKSEMADSGLRYEDYLPIEYKKKNPVKKPLADITGIDEELFYIYGDGGISREYYPDRAKMRFNRLEDKSGVDWNKSYDPNGSVKKAGWHGEYDEGGTWVRVEEGAGSGGTSAGATVLLELLKYGDGAILYDPGMQLLASPILMYAGEGGEVYGCLEGDNARLVEDIREKLKEMGIPEITAIGGVSGDSKVLGSYREALKGLAGAELKAVDNKTVRALKEAHIREAVETTGEKAGVSLEKKLRAIGKHASGMNVLEALAAGNVTVELSPRNRSDGAVLGMSEEDIREIGLLPVKAENEAAYDAVLSNLYAGWQAYEGGMSRQEAAHLVHEYMDNPAEAKTPVVTAQTSLEEIILGREEKTQGGVRLYASGIPGVFSEPETVNFYDEGTKEKYVKSLERRRILPKGGAEAALSVLKTLPEAEEEKKAALNKGLTRALGQYKAISMSAGIPIAELVQAVKEAVLNAGSRGGAASRRNIYYELELGSIVKEGRKENRQKRDAPLNKTADEKEEAVIIGGVSGHGLDENVLTGERLIKEYSFSEEEAAKAEKFLHSVRYTEPNPVILFLLESVKKDKAGNAKELRRSILAAVEADGRAAYNLNTDTGLEAYMESGCGKELKVSRKEIRALVREEKEKIPAAVIPPSAIAKVEMKYVDRGGIISLTRSAPVGMPEKIQLVQNMEGSKENIGIGENIGIEENISVNETGGADAVELTGITGEKLHMEYGYTPEEAEEAMRYLGGIRIPAGREVYFEKEVTPVLMSILKETREANVFKERAEPAIKKYGVTYRSRPGGYVRTGSIPQTASHYSPEPFAIPFGRNAEAVPLERVSVREITAGTGAIPVSANALSANATYHNTDVFRPAPIQQQSLQTEKPATENLNMAAEGAATPGASNFPAGTNTPPMVPGAANTPTRANTPQMSSRANYMHAIPPRETGGSYSPTNASGSYPSGASQSGYNVAGMNMPSVTAEAARAETASAATGAATSNVFNFEPESDPRSKSPGSTPRDAELERLRKIEANYEKDKASLAKQKQPALARSESHEVGHAEGDDGTSFKDSKVATRELVRMIKQFVNEKLGS